VFLYLWLAASVVNALLFPVVSVFARINVFISGVGLQLRLGLGLTLTLTLTLDLLSTCAVCVYILCSRTFDIHMLICVLFFRNVCVVDA